MNASDKDLFYEIGRSILNSVITVLESCDRSAPECSFVGFDRPPEDKCGLVVWIGNVRPYDGNTLDGGLREGRLLCYNSFAFDVTVRMSRCFIDFNDKGPLSADVIEEMSKELLLDAHVLYIQWVGALKGGQVSNLDNCDPVALGTLTPYRDGTCAGWEFTITVGVM